MRTCPAGNRRSYLVGLGEGCLASWVEIVCSTFFKICSTLWINRMSLTATPLFLHTTAARLQASRACELVSYPKRYNGKGALCGRKDLLYLVAYEAALPPRRDT